MKLLLAVAALAASPAQPFPTGAGQCGWVHARFSIYNGSGVQRLWVIGTSHMLALYDDDDRYPAALRRLVDAPAYRSLDTDIYGDFLVCARERWRPGHMQHVRFKAARRLLPVKRDLGSSPEG